MVGFVKWSEDAGRRVLSQTLFPKLAIQEVTSSNSAGWFECSKDRMALFVYTEKSFAYATCRPLIVASVFAFCA